MRNLARRYYQWRNQMRENHFAAKEGREPKTIPIQMTPDELAEFRSNRAFWAQIEVPK